MILWTSILFSYSIYAQNIPLIYLNNSGVKALKEQKTGEAQNQFLKALQDPELSGLARLNLGLSFELNKQPDAAIKEYKEALSDPKASEEIKFFAHYNLGRVYQVLENKEAALNEYQSALNIRRDSNEVKHNIEILTQQGGGGGGKGDQKDDQGKEGDPNSQPNKGTDPEEQKKEAQAKPRELSEKDMQKILDELKNQEQQIRAKEYDGDQKRSDQNGKDW